MISRGKRLRTESDCVGRAGGAFMGSGTNLSLDKRPMQENLMSSDIEGERLDMVREPLSEMQTDTVDLGVIGNDE